VGRGADQLLQHAPWGSSCVGFSLQHLIHPEDSSALDTLWTQFRDGMAATEQAPGECDSKYMLSVGLPVEKCLSHARICDVACLSLLLLPCHMMSHPPRSDECPPLPLSPLPPSSPPRPPAFLVQRPLLVMTSCE